MENTKTTEKELNLIGQKFGKLKVINYHFSESGRQIICTVQCECGSEPRDYPLYLLTNGNTQSCGCARYDNKKKKRNIVGMKLGKLTIVSVDEETGTGHVKCECGNEYDIPNIRARVAGLRKVGMCKKCKAKERQKYGDLKPKDRFNFFTVIEKVEDDDKGQAQYLCSCQCGKKKVVLGKYLVSGKTKSCGCIKSQNFDKKKTLNGLTATPEGKKLYEIWSHFLLNLANPPSQRFKEKYVDTGIKFFPEWSKQENGFIQFYNWAMLKSEPFDLKTRRFLCRIDESKDFTPENCYFSRIANND